jgi:hypothetical protein
MRNRDAKLREAGELQKLFLLQNARSRSRRLGIPFNLTLDTISIPEHCPVLGVKLEFGMGKPTPNSASIDRIIPSLGYVTGNIIVVSMRANVIKSDASPDEVIRVGQFYKTLMEQSNDAH